MFRPRTPLDAYHTDLVGAPNLEAFGPDDGVWLLVAELLARRAAGARGADPEAVSAAGRDLAAALAATGTPPPPPAGGGGTVDGVLRVTAAMEERGALHLAATTLRLLIDAHPDTAPRARGLILAQQARVARGMGALDAAHDLYDQVAVVGTALRDPDLRVRALLGQAVVARRRGNYPAARVAYTRALRAAERARLGELTGLAHQGLLVTAGTAGDTDAALRHGWLAFQHFGEDDVRRADVLSNLGAVSSAAGHHAAALGAYLGAVRRAAAPRVRLPALGGAALCAARLGDSPQLRRITRDAEAELGCGALPYEHAHALSLLADAWAVFHPQSGGEPYRARGLAVAREHQFHELVVAAERAADVSGRAVAAAPPTSHGATAPHRPSTGSRGVLRALEALDRDPHVDVMVAC